MESPPKIWLVSCKECEGMSIQGTAWVNPNTLVVTELLKYSKGMTASPLYCSECHENTGTHEEYLTLEEIKTKFVKLKLKDKWTPDIESLVDYNYLVNS